jgi:hypothetical protein
MHCKSFARKYSPNCAHYITDRRTCAEMHPEQVRVIYHASPTTAIEAEQYAHAAGADMCDLPEKDDAQK